MKKSLIIAALGIAGFAASSNGQGVILFSTYAGSYQGGSISPTMFFNGPSAGNTIGSQFTATLYYALGTVADSVDTGSAASITSPISGSFNLVSGSATTVDGGGYVQGPQLTISDWSSGPITFEILWTATIGGVDYSGRSGAFTESQLYTGSAVTSFGSFGPGVPPTFVAQVTPVPEPSTLALAGLGGFGMLMALRRKKA